MHEEVTMKTQMRLLAALLCLIASLSAHAVSHPSITGTISGVELCPQSICGQAAFAGSFSGFVNKKGTSGVFLVQVTHGSLPDTAGGTTPVTGGSWLIRTEKDRVIAGTITGGTLTYNGDGTFTVVLTLELTQGGNGTVTFTGLLDHNVFPPTIAGTLSQ
jgi:hypothetical protein